MMTHHPMIMGIDGGATKISAREVLQSRDGFCLGESHSQYKYSDSSLFIEKFSPVDIQIQLKEMKSKIQLTSDELNQGKAIIETFIKTISDLYRDKPVVLGIGMPGLKTLDGRGIAAMANGPRMPQFSDDLEKALINANIQLAKPIHRLGSDADYCGLGEEYAKDGLFQSVENGYYLGGGTGSADALKLNGELVPLDQTKSWLLKSWEMVNAQNIPLEKFASAGGIQSIYCRHSGIPMDILIRDSVYPTVILELAHQGEDAANLTFRDVSHNLAELIFERIETIFSGWSGRFGLINPDRAVPSPDHPFLGTVVERIILGQRLGMLLNDSKGMGLFWEPLTAHIVHRIEEALSLNSTAKSTYLKNGELNPDLIHISTLRDAPALGAGIDAVLFEKNN
ncbi:MAG: hypothetical protein ACE5D0_01835 [Fidelibacterota bacterium]